MTLPLPAATLSVVGTPIGNLGDITLRAIETLKNASVIAAEDTRHTRALLSHLGIRGKQVTSLDAHASERAIEALIAKLEAGESVALVTDAGMPSVSDPGAALVNAAVERGLGVSVVPGPSAVTAAVALSGLGEGGFAFFGFLPRKGAKRSDAIGRIVTAPECVVLFEAPGRTAATLADLAAVMPERRAAVCRELTKVHEEVARGTLAQLAARDEWRGEVTLVIAAAPATVAAVPEQAVNARIDALLGSGASARDVAGRIAVEYALPRRDAYARVQARTEKGEP